MWPPLYKQFLCIAHNIIREHCSSRRLCMPSYSHIFIYTNPHTLYASRICINSHSISLIMLNDIFIRNRAYSIRHIYSVQHTLKHDMVAHNVQQVYMMLYTYIIHIIEMQKETRTLFRIYIKYTLDK